MNKLLLLITLIVCFEVNAADNFHNRAVNVLSRGYELFGSASRTHGREVGKICSRLYGLTSDTHNQIVTACKVCYVDEFTDANWPDENKVREYRLKEGDEIVIKGRTVGGSSHISEGYDCSYDASGASQCDGDNVHLQGTVTRTKKKLEIMCTTSRYDDITRKKMNLIFKDVFDFRPEFYNVK